MADDSVSGGLFKRMSNFFGKSSIYANSPSAGGAKPEDAGDAKKKDSKECKTCQICSEQRKAKDKCIKEKGESKCKDLIKAFEDCMKKNGGDPKKDKK